ncbi:nucleotide-binding universal stress UspA family protein [Kribbella orskensis]|uniref:Nucleotide-binding universal stress UspA family protein n=1 Tax=Kribbella orskensis TaxID=2512216 RepID=A0ABY2BAL2_9ACTN|nr:MULTISPECIES: universal stress protein [Kribbella]TCN31172.1 nucleotide-binding universal stress UspA family protein [Kribbella sp. VKM Ac-2500]TCO11678.1 nucleotide-binding universal stress UspA family protein [Kribbella orskensis]
MTIMQEYSRTDITELPHPGRRSATNGKDVLAGTSIVVGVDGSIMSEAAVRWAAAEAAVRRARLKLVHAFIWPLLRLPPGCGELLLNLKVMADNVVRESLEIAHTAAAEVPADGGKVAGYPLPVLLGESRTADLLVVGSGGPDSTLGPLIGSVSAELAAHAYCPVVVIRPQQSGQTAHRVVAGYDGSAASEAALDFALAHANRHNLSLQVITVRPPHSDGHNVTEDLLATIKTRPAGACAQLLYCDGHPAEQLLHHSADAELVVLGSRGRGGFNGLPLGSVSQAVLQQAACPVAVIPTTADRR